MQVLIENPFAPMKTMPFGLLPTFWSEKVFYMGSTFSMSSLMSLTESGGLSPYAVVDARVSLLISILNKGTSVYAHNLGALGVVVTHFDSLTVTHHEDTKKVNGYMKEYIPPKGIVVSPELPQYDQVIAFGDTEIIQYLWEKVKVGGFYILGSITDQLSVSLPPESFEAVKDHWPCGEATEFGWRFQEENLGLKDFQMVKLKKLR